DGNGGTDTATVNIGVIPVNDAPIAVNDAFKTPEDIALNITATQILANDTDVDGDTLTVTAVDTATAKGGSVTFDSLTGAIVYTPATDYNGPDSFTYTISDGNGGTDTATVNIGVIPVNTAPDAVDDGSATCTPSAGNLEMVFIDEEAGYQNTLGFYTVNALGEITAVHVNFENTSKVGSGGSLIGGISTSDINIAEGEHIEFFLIAQGNTRNDYDNLDLNTGELKFINSTGANANVNDNEVPTLTLTDAGGNAVTLNGYIYHSSNTNLNHDGKDHVKVSLKDADTVSLGFEDLPNLGDLDYDDPIVEVNTGDHSVNVAGIVIVGTIPAGATAFDTDEDTVLNLTATQLLVNDTDADGDTLTITNVSSTTANGGTVSYNSATGDIVFTPKDDFNGNDNFTYTITDGNGGFDTATVYVCVKAVNDAPVAVNDYLNAIEDNDLNFTLNNILNNDFDVDGDTLSMTSFDTSTSLGGTLSFNAVTEVFTYQPVKDFAGRDSFEYTITDGNGGYDTATVFIDVADTPDLTDAPKLEFKGLCNSFGINNFELTHDVNITDTDSTSLASASIIIATGFQPGDELNLPSYTVDALGNIAGTGIKFTYNNVTGALALTGTDSLSTYTSVIEALRFDTSAIDGTRELSVTVTDDSGATSNIATLKAHVLQTQVSGTDNDDTIYGTGKNDHLVGKSGNDRLEGEDGDDKLVGNDGDDILHGGAGDDRLDGGLGDDVLYADNDGQQGDDCLHGGSGNDVLYGFGGNDYLDGQDGNDIIRGGLGNDTLVDFGAAASTLHTYNIVLNIDLSASMNWTDAVTGAQTRIEILKDALLNLSNSLESYGNEVTLTLVQFNAGTKTTSFNMNDFDAFENYISDTSKFYADGGTRYTNALDDAKDIFDNSTISTNTHHNVMYFVSDGSPNFGFRESDLGFDWSDYSDANNIETHAIGIGSASNKYLDPIDNTGTAEILNSAADLTATLEANILGTDKLYGEEGNDYIDGGLGSDELYGGDGNDTLVFDANDTVIDGGNGNDTLLITDSSSPVDFGQFGMNSIEAVDMNDGTVTTLQLNAADVLRISDTGQMMISGDTGDIVDASEYSVRGADSEVDGSKFAHYSNATNGTNILVEVGLELNGYVITEQ
ncbi:MAG: hypothetical protein ACI9TY_001145, partial [Alphaproteobacteria bacterium]